MGVYVEGEVSRKILTEMKDKKPKYIMKIPISQKRRGIGVLIP
jgi:hypothetical protein